MIGLISTRVHAGGAEDQRGREVAAAARADDQGGENPARRLAGSLPRAPSSFK